MRSLCVRARALAVALALLTSLASGLTGLSSSVLAFGEPTTRELLERMGVPIPGASSQSVLTASEPAAFAETEEEASSEGDPG
ncbi:MAG: hypothetical protein AAF441_21120, partial [Pseudomonadota bacterium]